MPPATYQCVAMDQFCDSILESVHDASSLALHFDNMMQRTQITVPITLVRVSVAKQRPDSDAMAKRGLTEDDLMPLTWEDEDDDWAEKPSIRIVDSKQLSDLIAEQDVILNF